MIDTVQDSLGFRKLHHELYFTSKDHSESQEVHGALVEQKLLIRLDLVPYEKVTFPRKFKNRSDKALIPRFDINV